MNAQVSSFLRRNSQTIPLAIIGLCIGGIFLLQAVTISRMSDQLQAQTEAIDKIKEVAKQIDDNAKNRTEQIQAIDRHLDCIVEFFSKPDRTQRAIANIDNCEISRATTGSQEPTAQGQTAITSPRSDPPKTQTNQQPRANTAEPEPSPAKQPEPQRTIIDRLLSPINKLLGGL